jgi:stage II sporulation protein P
MAWKIHRRRRTYFYDLKIIRILVIAGILFGMLILGFAAGSRVRAAETDQMSAWRLIGIRGEDWQKILSQVLPMASYMPEYIEDESTGIIIAAL